MRTTTVGSNPTADSGAAAGGSVLFIDDDGPVRRAFTRSARRAGYKVDAVASSEEAIAAAATAEYAVVVSDLNLVNSDGLTLIESLREQLPRATYLLLTGAQDLRLPDTASSRGIVGVIPKPWGEDELAATLGRAYDLYCERLLRDGLPTIRAPRRVSMLLVEADPSDVQVAQRLLAQVPDCTYTVVVAARLEDALARMSEQRFDVILTDLNLPDARGFDTITRLQRAEPETPVIILSGGAGEELALHAVQMGAQDYLVKGKFEAARLHRSIRYSMERKRTEERFVYLAHHDQLTALGNRKLFDEQLARALSRADRRGSKVSVMFLDLDRFKEINDTYGHETGDVLLQSVARRLQASVRDSDVVCRFGGDEFAVILEDITRDEEVAAVANRMIAALAQPVLLNERQEMGVKSSIGIASYPTNALESADLLKCADLAMYRAKHRGRNHYQFYSSETQHRALERESVAGLVQGALADARIFPFFQPVWRSQDMTLVGFDALLRLQDRAGEWVEASRVVPYLEETGLIRDAGRSILREACRQARLWHLQVGVPFRVAVNISRRQFDDAALPGIVADALSDSGLVPESLELHIHEQALNQPPERTLTVLQNLRRLGLRLTIDNFGSESTPLCYLDKLEFDGIKLGRRYTECLTSAVAEGPRHKAEGLVRALAYLAHELQMEVTAEGVEDDRQREGLAKLGCDLLQGYGLGRPEPADQTLALLSGEPGPAQLPRDWIAVG